MALLLSLAVGGTPSAVADQPQGVASCAAAACHNQNGPKGSLRSEYTTWAAYDPHARAYEVLYNDRSRRIMKLLKPREEPHPEKEALCLSCHAYPDPTLQGPPTAARFSTSDGVGCEACHGPAEKWLARHYSTEWKGFDPARKADLGFVDTKNLHTRAEVCARCHVGHQDMDVNHDLIAAGHPRLRFDFGAYLANYSFRHWKRADDVKRYPDLEARAWLVGQLTSARAAVELTSHRAANSGRKPWPEFAEYNCAACHHQLAGGLAPPAKGKRLPGDLLWGTWYFPLLPTLASTDRGAPKEFTNTLATFGGLMEKRVPHEADVITKAKDLADDLKGWGKAAACDPIDLHRLFAGVTEANLDKGRGPAQWDAATEQYLGLAAVLHAMGDRNQPVKPGLSAAVKALGGDLTRAFPDDRDNIYDSPSRYSPDDIRDRLKRIRELLK